MSGQFWTTEELQDLLTAWKNRRADITAQDFAIDYSSICGRTFNSVYAKLKTMPEFKIPSSTRVDWDNPPTVEGDAFLIGDTQIPFHHAEFINRCLEVCARWKIENIILGGDVLDMNALSTFPPNFENDQRRVIDHDSAAELVKLAETLPFEHREKLLDIVGSSEPENNIGSEIKESRIVLKAFEENFQKLLWVMGNHEQRVLRTLQKILPVDTLETIFGTDNPKWTTSPYYWAVLKSGGEEWQIEHPMNTTKHSSKRFAPKFSRHIVMFHNHQFSITTDPSGKFYAIEPGGGMNESKMQYVMQRHNAADAHMVGALIVRDGKPTVLNKFTDWKMLK